MSKDHRDQENYSETHDRGANGSRETLELRSVALVRDTAFGGITAGMARERRLTKPERSSRVRSHGLGGHRITARRAFGASSAIRQIRSLRLEHSDDRSSPLNLWIGPIQKSIKNPLSSSYAVLSNNLRSSYLCCL